MTVSDRSVLRYPGGKSRACKILETMLPPNVHNVCSPFIGGGSFELFLTKNNIQVEGFDKFRTLTIFWQELLSQPEELAEEIAKYSHKVDKTLFKELQNELKETEKNQHVLNPLDTAVKFFVLNRCSFSGATLSGGYSKESSEKRFTASIIDKVRNFNNPFLTVKHADCYETLDDLDEKIDLLFLDPPYFLETDKNVLYGVNGDLHKNFNHYLFKEKIEKLQKPFLLTYNNSSEIRELWSDYHLVETNWSYGMNKSKKSSELIVRNY